MPPYQADSAALPTTTRFHLALANLADETVGTLARLFAYVGALALLAILALAALGQLPSLRDDDAPLKPGWSLATRSHPAFAARRNDSTDKSATYNIFRHPEGGRRDVLRWGAGDDRVTAELEIYRSGGEFDPAQPAVLNLAGRMGLDDTAALEQAGLIDSKFGPVALFRRSGAAKATPSCLGYLKRIEDPALTISGWSCQGEGKSDSMPALRANVACTLDRLVLLTSGNEPKLAELFANAELKRGSCGAGTAPDWLSATENAPLRGAL
jgi:hypothetical protein